MRFTEAHRIASLKNLEKAAAANQERNAKRTKTYFNCKTCGIAVVCKPSHLSKKTYCSKACMAEGYKTTQAGTANPNFRNSGQKICEGCAAPFQSYIKQRRYCSRLCYQSLEISRETSRVNGRKNRRAGGRCDRNQPEIVSALRSIGASVLITSNQGGGFPDLVVGWRGHNYLLEVKESRNFLRQAGVQ